MNEMFLLEKQKAQSGQALVEYVLFLIIGVALILGLANQFYKPFGNWVQNQMGPYLECLLDVGELPTLSGEATGECLSSYKRFASQEGGTGSASRNSKSPSNKNSTANKKDEDSSKGSTTSGGNSSVSKGANQGFKIGAPQGADGNSKTNGDSQVMTEKLPESKFFKLRSSSNAIISLPKQSFVTGLAGTLRSEQREKKSNEEGTFKAGNIDQSSGEGKPQRLLLKPVERKMAADDPEPPWTFAKYIKFAVILIIIVAIVLFLAGQFMQISKGMEK